MNVVVMNALSTLIRCLNGLEEYRQGTITFEGKQINTTEKNWQQIRRNRDDLSELRPISKFDRHG